MSDPLLTLVMPQSEIVKLPKYDWRSQPHGNGRRPSQKKLFCSVEGCNNLNERHGRCLLHCREDAKVRAARYRVKSGEIPKLRLELKDAYAKADKWKLKYYSLLHRLDKIHELSSVEQPQQPKIEEAA